MGRGAGRGQEPRLPRLRRRVRQRRRARPARGRNRPRHRPRAHRRLLGRAARRARRRGRAGRGLARPRRRGAGPRGARLGGRAALDGRERAAARDRRGGAGGPAGDARCGYEVVRREWGADGSGRPRGGLPRRRRRGALPRPVLRGGVHRRDGGHGRRLAHRRAQQAAPLRPSVSPGRPAPAGSRRRGCRGGPWRGSSPGCRRGPSRGGRRAACPTSAAA